MYNGGWGAGGGGNEELVFNGYRVSVWEDEKSSGDAWRWWLHDDVKVLNATEVYS